ncbi:MAG: glycosyltransferase [Gemmatimonadales bacterium]|nr:glycosyltransferase [Gemmatimonadales bacterium]NIN12807.1 glycosyltransferase [Gemmatimonadales bacterium]NIN48735.1 glycosyltransferase [Gemmatimonadales bacterium]NIP06199.1 glycosyltransferase [Gemmatimonadales bacterium]NIR01384.1 glycosyltransferase [Gemmatimonadales bacterium]
MKILAVNWLDRENPQAGGAEIHFFEIFRRLVARGHEVTLIVSGWKGAPPTVNLDGLTVQRFGGRHSFALKGRRAVRRALAADRYDVIVEDINKLPLYLPTLTRLPFYVIIPHLFGATAFQEASWPVASVVWLAEKLIPYVYRRAVFHAISDSTRDDLVHRGVDPGAVRVIYPGVDAEWYHPHPHGGRAPTPTFLYVGRLKRYKGVDTALRAAAAARQRRPDLRLEIVGAGDDRRRLEQLAAGLGLGDAVRFLGFVSEEDKRDLLRHAWGVVFPSAKEGWGISNVEAAACGTPAIASDSPGLRESVQHGETGILVPHDDSDALASALLRLSSDVGLVETLGRAARRFAETLSWERAAELTEAHLAETVEGVK